MSYLDPDPDLDLSLRELEVLRLLAAGMSNKEIGAELFIGVETVKTHLSTIYRKLGVTRRGQAAAWMNGRPDLLAEPGTPLATATTEPITNGCRVLLGGEFDMTSTQVLADALQHALSDGPRVVELDMTGVLFMDSSALRTLVAARNDHPDSTLKVIDASRSVRRLLEFTQLAEVFGLEL